MRNLWVNIRSHVEPPLAGVASMLLAIAALLAWMWMIVAVVRAVMG